MTDLQQRKYNILVLGNYEQCHPVIVDLINYPNLNLDIGTSEPIAQAKYDQYRHDIIIIDFDNIDEYKNLLQTKMSNHSSSLIALVDQTCPQQIKLCQSIKIPHILSKPLKRRALYQSIKQITTISMLSIY